MNISLSRILLSGLFVIALILAACSGSGTTTTAMTTTETLEEILAQAIDVEMVKYDCVYIFRISRRDTNTQGVV